MMGLRRVGLGVAGISVAGLMWAGSAFACSVLPKVSAVVPEAAAPGQTVLVEGQAPWVRADARAVPQDSPVEIRWNGVGGQVLGQTVVASNGLFSVPVVIPQTAPGVYSLTLVTNAGVGRAAVEVTAPGGALPAAAPQLWPSATSQPLESPSSAGISPVGVILLGVGLTGLLAGSTIAVARTRRVPAGPQA